MKRIPRVLFALLLGAGCSTNPVDPEPKLEIVIEGPLERGREYALELLRQGTTVPAAQVVWGVTPTGVASLQPDGRLVPLQVGQLTLSASVDGQSVSTTTTVIAPPVVVFDRFVDANRDIWAISLDGMDLRRLTTHTGDDSDPTSAAGMVAFVSYRNGTADLYSVPLAGGTERRLTTGARNEVAPSLSSDGRRLAYTNDVAVVTKLWTLNMETLATSRLTVNGADSGDIHASPSWWGVSDSIAFMTTARGSADIDIVRVSTGNTEVAVEERNVADVEPAISPDGQKIVFVSNRDGNDELYVATLATGETTRLTNRPGSDANPAWLPDGRIVYVAVDGAETALCWLDPEVPNRVHRIPGTEGARRPSGT